MTTTTFNDFADSIWYLIDADNGKVFQTFQYKADAYRTMMHYNHKAGRSRFYFTDQKTKVDASRSLSNNQAQL